MNGLFTLQMKILSSFTCHDFNFLLNTKEDTLQNDGDHTKPAPIDFHCIDIFNIFGAPQKKVLNDMSVNKQGQNLCLK